MKEFKAPIGDVIERANIHYVYGGRTQPRISPAGESPYIFLFIDPVGEESAGSPSGMAADGTLHVAGEGLGRDQVMKSGNLSLLRHAEDGKALHVLTKVEKGRYRYAGRFRIAENLPFYRMDMPAEASADAMREGIVFRLNPAGPVGMIPRSTLVSMPGTEELRKSEAEVMALPNGKASAMEAVVSASFAVWMARSGFSLKAIAITPEDEYQAITVPLVDETGHVYCPCASSSRTVVRAAIGEAIDLKRIMNTEEATILLPSEPREDVLRLIEYAGLSRGWPRENGWHLVDRNTPSSRQGDTPRPRY